MKTSEPVKWHFTLPLLTAGSLLFVASVQQDPFFWDTIQLASKHAHHFYNNGLRWTPLPEAVDSGHPPILGFYIACLWHFFGKTLPVSHWAMAPFLLANAVLVYQLGRRLSSPLWAWALVLLVFADPVVSGQHALVSPDILVVCGFLMAVEGVLARRNGLLCLGALLLCASSMRGMMTAAALLAWCLALGSPLFSHQANTYHALRKGLYFLPGFAFAAWFLWWHQQATGWTGFHSGSPWAQAFTHVNAAGFLKNTAVLGWRFLDFGRLFEWLVLALLLWQTIGLQWFKPENKSTETTADGFAGPGKIQPASLLVLFLCLAVFLLPAALRYQNLSAHRYFLPLFIALHLLVFQLLAAKKQVFYTVLLLLGFLSGHCWIYPRGISMDWDSTLAHRPYHRLREAAIDWLTAQNIPFSAVGSAFPNLNTGENLMLNGDTWRFSDKDFSKNAYIFASNIFNDFSESDYALLEKEWHLLKHFEEKGVWIEIYGK